MAFAGLRTGAQVLADVVVKQLELLLALLVNGVVGLASVRSLSNARPSALLPACALLHVWPFLQRLLVQPALQKVVAKQGLSAPLV